MDNNAASNTSFPAPDVSDSIKNTDEYGIQVAKAIYGANKDYLAIRNARFYDNNLYFKGKQPIGPYLDLLNINGKQAFINLKFKPRPVAKKFVKIISAGFMAKKENPSVSSLNPIVQDKKNDVINRAKWVILEKDFINNMQNQTGMQLEAKGVYIPGTVQEAEFYYGLNNKQQEEFLLEMMIKAVHKDNDYLSQKRRILRDLMVYGVAGVFDYVDQNGKIVYETVPGEELGYGPSKKEDFSDSNYFFRYKRMSVSDFRKLQGNKMTEEQIYSVAKSFANKNTNGLLNYPFNQSYYTAYRRPYDSFVIDLMWVWYKAEKNIKTSTGLDSKGRFVYDIGQAADIYESSNRTVEQKAILVGYDGWWVLNTDYIVGWGPSRNMLKRDDELEKVECPLSVYMIDNDGEMDASSMVEDMISPIVEMDLDILKIQQIKAQQAPNGLLIDIDGLDDIDLGLGRGALKPLELREIRSQQGDVYYRSHNEPGDVSQGPPIKQLNGDFGNVLQELVADYNFQLNTLRDYVGVNEYRDGSTVNPKTGLGVIQNQMDNSNNATQHIYDALVHLVKRLDRHIGQRLWDVLRNPDIFSGYRAILGDLNAEFISKADDITASLYDIDIETDMSDEEAQELQQQLGVAQSKGFVSIQDVFAIQNMPNKRYAAQYLSIIAAKNQAKQEQVQAQNVQANAQAANDSITLKAQSEQSIAQIKAQSDSNVAEAKIQGKIMEMKLEFYNTMREQAFVLGKDIPAEIQQEIDAFNQEQQAVQQYGVQQMLQAKQQQAQQAQQQQQAQAGQQPDPNHIQPTSV